MTLTDAILEEVIEPFKDELAKYRLRRLKDTYLWWPLDRAHGGHNKGALYYVTLNQGILWFGANITPEDVGPFHYPRANQRAKIEWRLSHPNTSMESIHKVLRKHINKLGYLYE